MVSMGKQYEASFKAKVALEAIKGRENHRPVGRLVRRPSQPDQPLESGAPFINNDMIGGNAEMKNENMNALVVSTHHDDLELGCDGSVARLVDGGHRVFSLVLTHSGYSAPDGTAVRTRQTALTEANNAANLLGYTLICGDEDFLDLPVNDANICRIINAIAEHKIDTVFTHWHGDTHPPHHRINEMVLHACRSVPRVLAVNWYIGCYPFDARTFVPVNESQWSRKIAALKCYESEFRRAGEKWVRCLDQQAWNFGAQYGVELAEGFVTYKNFWEF
jgi:LmbE family N-acetylglucosaminyl deacetylase